MAPTPRVVVTGCGLWCALGRSFAEFAAALRSGRSAIAPGGESAPQALRGRVAARLSADPAEHFPRAALTLLDPVSRYAVLAGTQALGQSGLLSDPELCTRTGVYLGTGLGGAQSIENAYGEIIRYESPPHPLTLLSGMHNAPAAQLSIRFGLRGPNLTFSCACASSSIALGEALHAVRSGRLPCVLAGGSEACILPGVLSAWEAMRVLAPADPDCPQASCRPFSRNRAGIVLGEGAALFVVETLESATRRAAPILCELLGYGAAADACHIANPSSEGQVAAMRMALADARLAPSDIAYINAHGTATRAGDACETRAIKQVFGNLAYQVPVSSTKSAHGHLLGAAGALEFAAGIAALREGFLPATLHLQEDDPECDLDYVPRQPRLGLQPQTFMSNSFAFGGGNAVLIAGTAAQSPPNRRPAGSSAA